jgi:DNA-directed RNA polymerase specialized sigma24 family protein
MRVADRGKGKRGRGGKGTGGPRSVLREIDDRLATLDRELAGHLKLVEERARLVAARAALTGEQPPPAVADTAARRLSQDEIADYLRAHPGSKAGEIARAFEVPLTNVSQHLYRGKSGRFEAQSDGWHLRKDA